MGRIDGKVAVVSGAASGIGYAAGERLAAEGAAVVLADLNEDGVNELAGRINDSGGRAVGIRVDVSDEGDVQAMIDAAVSNFGRLDILHNNAAGVGNDVIGKDNQLHELETEIFDRTMAINARGVFMACKYAIPVMAEQEDGGSIINMASMAGSFAELSWTAYGASKAAVILMTKSIATNYGDQNIRCNSIAPGLIVTSGNVKVAPQDYFDLVLRSTPRQRLGTPEDVASAVLFLGSDESYFINGVNIELDGGLTKHVPHWAELRAWTAAQV